MSEAPTGVLLMAYGAPRTTGDILAYYTDIRRGIAPTSDELAVLTARYEAIGGTSPLTQRTEAQRRALQSALDATRPGRYHVALGMKHAAPTIEQAVDDLAGNGFRRIVGLVLAPHYSAASVGQYLDRLRVTAAAHDVAVDSIASWATEPAFVDFIARDVRAKLAQLPKATCVVFTAHSLPIKSLAPGDPYVEQVNDTAAAVAGAAGVDNWRLAWQSAARTGDPWLSPSILEAIDELGHDRHVQAILVSAVGFVADHLEVLYDLDIEAAKRAADRGLLFARTTSVNDDPAVMAALAERVIAA